MENLNSPQKDSFSKFSKRIEEIKKPFLAALGGILTYKKSEETGSLISTKFFNENLKDITKEDIETAVNSLKQQEIEFKKLKIELIDEKSFNDAQKKILLQIINGNILKLMLLQESVYIEAEKGGYPLDKREKEDRLKRIEKLETMIYGPKISDSPEEKTIVMTYLDSLYSQNKDKLSEEEDKIFAEFLQKFPERKENKEKENKEDILEKIDATRFYKIFQKIFDIYNIDNKIVIIDNSKAEVIEEEDILYIPGNIDQKEREQIFKDKGLDKIMKIIIDPKSTSIAVGENNMKIPTSYKELSIKRICELMDHEISTHAITNQNNKKTLNIKSDTYLELQEGVAVLNEKLVTNKVEDLDIDEPTEHNISTLIAENYNAEDCRKLFEIYYKMIGEKNYIKKAEDRVSRTKRFHSFDGPGASRKDVAYRRGLADTIMYMKGLDKNKLEDKKRLQEDVFKFYLSKLGKDEMANADKLTEGFDVSKGDIIMPIAMGKIIYEKMLGNKVNSIDDIRFLASKNKLNYKQIKILLQIIQLMKKSK